MKRILGLALVLMLGATPGLWAQASTGNVYGTVTDASGAVLPGASVTISGTTLGARSTTAGTQGDFRFLNLNNGTYKLVVALAGFATVNREIVVTTGQNVNLSFAMKVATVEETVTVTAETPTVDTKRVGTATTLTKEELAQVPQSRDPWAVLKTVPGVLVDRVNVAGNESGQQSGFVSKGSLASDTQWNLDGVVITDVNSNGASSSYFDFDAFEEINVSTGSGDIKVQTGGIGINFVTKRGTNTFHGSVRGFLANHELQSSNLPDELVGDPRIGNGDNANHTDQIWDWGAEIGGPIIKDKLWFWGSYGKNDIRIARLNQTQDKTLLKNKNAKVNWQASKNDMVSLFWFDGAKVKLGRDPGVVGDPDDSFLWNQGNFYPEEDCGMPCGLHGLWKAEWNHTFSPNFFLNAKYAYYGWGYGFAQRGGADQEGGIDYDARPGLRLLPGLHRPQALAHRQPRRQLLRERHGRPARVQVRIRLPQAPGPHHHDLRRQPGPRHQQRRRRLRGPRDPSAQREVHRRRLERLHRRRLHQGPHDRQPGRALGSSEVLQRAQHGPGQPGVPRSAAVPGLSGHRLDHHLEQLLAPGEHHPGPRRVAQDGGSRARTRATRVSSSRTTSPRSARWAATRPSWPIAGTIATATTSPRRTRC